MYTDYKNKTYNLHVIKTKNFKTITIKINFKKLLNKEDITYRNLLGKVLLNSSKNYPNKQDIEIETEELYNLGLSFGTTLTGNYIVSSLSCNFLNENYTEKDMNNKSIEFLLDILFNPNINNNQFKYFDLAKRLVNDEIKASKDNIKRYAIERLYQILGKDTPLEYNSIGYIEDLNNIKPIDLVNYYKDMIKTNIIDIFIIGDVDADVMNDTFKEKFKINTLKKPSESHIVTYDKSKLKKEIETIETKQTNLSLGYKIKDLDDFERQYVLYVYTFILGGNPNSKLFKNVREKNSLCYSINSTFKALYNIMYITAGTNKKDAKKCINLIKKEVSKMGKGDFKENDIEAAKITYINSLKDIEDYQGSILKMYESHIYFNYDLLEDRIENITKVTKKDIINLHKKLKLDTIYILEGEDNEEN